MTNFHTFITNKRFDFSQVEKLMNQLGLTEKDVASAFTYEEKLVRECKVPIGSLPQFFMVSECVGSSSAPIRKVLIEFLLMNEVVHITYIETPPPEELIRLFYGDDGVERWCNKPVQH